MRKVIQDEIDQDYLAELKRIAFEVLEKRWSPLASRTLNGYYNLDFDVEISQLLAEFTGIPLKTVTEFVESKKDKPSEPQ